MGDRARLPLVLVVKLSPAITGCRTGGTQSGRSQEVALDVAAALLSFAAVVDLLASDRKSGSGNCSDDLLLLAYHTGTRLVVVVVDATRLLRRPAIIIAVVARIVGSTIIVVVVGSGGSGPADVPGIIARRREVSMDLLDGEVAILTRTRDQVSRVDTQIAVSRFGVSRVPVVAAIIATLLAVVGVVACRTVPGGSLVRVVASHGGKESVAVARARLESRQKQNESSRQATGEQATRKLAMDFIDQACTS
jgi:hypothetical protein